MYNGNLFSITNPEFKSKNFMLTAVKTQYLLFVDSLVFHFQFIHDGHLPRWIGVDDTDANTTERLC